MQALYMISGVLTGTAGAALAMGANGRLGFLFILAAVVAIIGAFLEYNSN